MRFLHSHGAISVLSLLAPGFLAGVTTRGEVFSTSLIPLSLKLDYSNFVQNYFGIK